MSISEDLIDFDIIESQKENIQSLPGGRSARTLANLFSPSPLHKQSTPTPSDTKNLNDAIRQEYEAEIVNIAESDDPLDIYDRYVRWTLDAYPSAQATPASQLLPLLERATKAFLNSAQYKNDPRYLKLWISYIKFFSDTPRETFAFLARHNIGEGLALFYEEFAAWLEGAGRWTQAEEVFKLGIDREARPTPRLLRKHSEFQERFSQRPENVDEPSSPALPTVRPALAAKIDPFFAPAPQDPQAPKPNAGVGGSSAKNGRQKLTIFSDAEDAAPALASGERSQGWESIGSLAERKKENTMEPKPWVGETLKAGGKKSSTKLAVFKDVSIPHISSEQIDPPSMQRVTVNPKNGRSEYVFVNLEALYPNTGYPGTEFSFEELMAGHRGWLNKTWNPEINHTQSDSRELEHKTDDSNLSSDALSGESPDSLVAVHDPVMLDENGLAKDLSREGRARKMKIKEINETQIIKAKLSSPSGPKMTKRKASKEQTMTLHTRAATDDIYDIFSQPLKPGNDEEEDEESDDYDGDMTDGDYTDGGESTGTGRLLTTSEAGDDETSDVKSVSEWSEFSARKHIPALEDNVDEEDTLFSTFRESDEDFPPIDVAVPSLIEEYMAAQVIASQASDEAEFTTPGETWEEEGLAPESPDLPPNPHTLFIPIPPEDYVPPTRPYRDAAQISQNRLPFMTPIAEKTESSLGIPTARAEKDYFDLKTPSKSNGPMNSAVRPSADDLCSSPFRELDDEEPPAKIAQPVLGKSVKTNKTAAIPAKVQTTGGPLAKEIAPKGPIVKDAQCNPVDEYTRDIILQGLQPPLSTYDGFFEHRDEQYGRAADIRKFAKAMTKLSKTSSEKTATNIAMPPVLQFPGTERKYTVKRELGSGAFAPVYLIENAADEEARQSGEGTKGTMGKGAFDSLSRKNFEALKMEDPPTPWEFYIMKQAKRRLGVSRAAESIVNVYEMHLYSDECYLIEEFRGQGTLLDTINIARADSSAPGGVMDETLCMFFAIELFRTVEGLHSKGILHGDLKADNCLVRLDQLSDSNVWSAKYRKDGTAGWDKKGIALIDFGRGIDMKVFRPEVQFIADWKTGPQDCAEMRELRPWTYQIDYHGLAAIIHSMLFGKYIETVAEKGSGIGAGAQKKWKIKEGLKRYWQTDIWSNMFDLLLNPAMHVEGEEGTRLPVLRSMKTIREEMEVWLEGNSEKGVGLQALIRKLEFAVKDKRK